MTTIDIVKKHAKHPFSDISKAREAGRKGGKVRSQARKNAAKLRSLREMAAEGLDISKHEDWIVSLILDPDRMSSDILNKLLTFMDEVKGKGNDELYQKLLNTYNQAYSNIHKQNVNLTQVNINKDTEINEEIDEFIESVNE